ncbi:hypothetical protein BpHYR1_053854 [Brachionus plicatilis]|uniref:Uncharacterized protein n=1 Tax=Brachionus plicatilis TaxID=10195 RepID=A0A3M7Q6X3_BRAPC|nr:hypothetical protein BpHYR1_053854 [Brachionus plicatilis]
MSCENSIYFNKKLIFHLYDLEIKKACCTFFAEEFLFDLYLNFTIPIEELSNSIYLIKINLSLYFVQIANQCTLFFTQKNVFITKGHFYQHWCTEVNVGRMCESDRKSLNTFHMGSLRKILGIHCPDSRKTNSEPLSRCIKNKRLRWLGYKLRVKETRIPKRALQWTPQGRLKLDDH